MQDFPNTKRKRMNVYIKPEVWMLCRHVAVDLGISASALVEQAIREFLKNQNEARTR